MAMNRGVQWYYGADGQIYPAENNGDGAEFPMAPVGEDGREVRLVEDPALIKARTIELLGYDPDDRQVNQNGSREVQIRNPMTGQFETGVITADGLEMPLGMAQAQGKQIIQYMSDPKESGGGVLGQVKEMYDEGAFMPMMMAAGVNALGGANMFGTNPGMLGEGEMLSSLADGFQPMDFASSTVEYGGPEWLPAEAGATMPPAPPPGGYPMPPAPAPGPSWGTPSTGTMPPAPPPIPTWAQGLVSQAGQSATQAGTSTALSRLLAGSGAAADWADLALKAAPGVLSAFGSDKQADRLSELSGKYLEMGAPSRSRYEASFAPGFDLAATDPAYKGALDSSAEAVTRKLSATGGNPYGNPGALIEANKAIVNGTALPAVQNYRNQNAATGGYGAFNTAAPGAAVGAANARGDVLSDLGGAFKSVTAPQQNLSDLLISLGLKGGSGWNQAESDRISEERKADTARRVAAGEDLSLMNTMKRFSVSSLA